MLLYRKRHQRFFLFGVLCLVAACVQSNTEELDGNSGDGITALSDNTAFSVAAVTPKSVLIIQDEREAMEVLASFLNERGDVRTRITDQPDGLTEDWNSYGAVVVYIHGEIDVRTEQKMLEYLKEGGRLVAIHHTIAGAKAKNRYLFEFAGMSMPGGGTEEATLPVQPNGAYGWRSGVEVSIVNLNPTHYITNNQIAWPEHIAYRSSDQPAIERDYPGYTAQAEAYLNHYFTDGRAKTVLLGMKYYDDRNNTLFMQDRAGWLKPIGRGWLIYLQPGHYVYEFENPVVRQMILNAITWRPGSH